MATGGLSREETARRGKQLYEQAVRPRVEITENIGKVRFGD